MSGGSAPPLAPGVYGGGDPITIEVPDLGDLGDLMGLMLGTIRADITITAPGGQKWACVRIRAKIV